MSEQDTIHDSSDAAVATLLTVNTVHGPLHGYLSVAASATGLVVIAHDTQRLDARDEHLARLLRQRGLSTLTVDLISKHEENYPDMHYHVTLLAKRLADFVGLMRHRMQMEEIAPQPIGLCGSNTTTPVVVRVASLRDHDIAAVVCRNGLIDLAGILYLKTLTSPLLALLEETDHKLQAGNQRALQEVRCTAVLKTIPDIGPNFAISESFALAAALTADWMQEHFAEKHRHGSIGT